MALEIQGAPPGDGAPPPAWNDEVPRQRKRSRHSQCALCSNPQTTSRPAINIGVIFEPCENYPGGWTDVYYVCKQCMSNQWATAGFAQEDAALLESVGVAPGYRPPGEVKRLRHQLNLLFCEQMATNVARRINSSCPWPMSSWQPLVNRWGHQVIASGSQPGVASGTPPGVASGTPPDVAPGTPLAPLEWLDAIPETRT